MRHSSTLVTFDLIVEGHRGIGDTFPSDTVENSARHREAHDTKDGLHAERQKQNYKSNFDALCSTFSAPQHKDKASKLSQKQEISFISLPRVSNCYVPPWNSCEMGLRQTLSFLPCRKGPAGEDFRHHQRKESSDAVCRLKLQCQSQGSFNTWGAHSA